jgi:spermidine synthase
LLDSDSNGKDAMSLSRFRSALRFVSRWATSTPGLTAVSGLLGGIYALVGLHLLTALLGATLPVTTGVGLAVAIGLAAGIATPRMRPAGRLSFGLIHLGLAVWAVACPWLAQLPMWMLHKVGEETLAQPGWPFCLSLASGLLILMPAAFGIARLPLCLAAADRRAVPGSTEAALQAGFWTTWATYLASLSAGCLAAALLLAPAWGVQQIGLAAALVGGLLFLNAIVRRTSGETVATDGENNREAETPGVEAGRPLLDSLTPVLGSRWGTALGVLCAGGLFAALSRIADQLMPTSSYLICAQWAALPAGLALGLFWRARTLRRAAAVGRQESTVFRAGACLLLAAWAVCVPALFPTLTWLSLWLNSYASEVWMLASGRVLMTLVLLAPVGLAWGLLPGILGLRSDGPAIDRNSATGETPNASAHRLGWVKRAVRRISTTKGGRLHVVMFFLGCAAVGWSIPMWGVTTLLLALAWLLLTMAVSDSIWNWSGQRRLPTGWLTRVGAVAAVCAVAAAPLWQTRYAPDRSAKLLFATNVAMANRLDFDAHVLPFLDEGRNIAVREGRNATYTAWKYRAHQIQMRSNGMPKSVISTHVRACPEFSPEVLQAVLPLLLNERPRHVMLLGLGGGTPLKACLPFPIQTITCAEPEPALVDLVAGTIADRAGHNPLRDDRVRLLPLDPAWAVAADGMSYDVIVCNSDQSASLQATPYFTTGFYRRAARRLSPTGVFCQRFQYVDYGSEPLRTLTATLQRVFADVTAIEMAPGELLFLATNSPRELSGNRLMARLRTQHVRRTIAEMGWDWSVLLNLAVYSSDELTKFVQGGDRTNTEANGRFAFQLPKEMMRWAPKYQDVQQALSPHVQRLLVRLGDRADSPELQHRLGEVAEQRQLMTSYPDQHWAYRKTLREQLRDRPRTTIVQVKGTGPEQQLHSEEKQRLEFFAALGEAARQYPPRTESIVRLNDFEAPYDPLLSYFLHQEIAELYARAEEHRDPAQELVHRCHAIYFSAPDDRSVRNVVAALKLLIEHPQATAKAEDRWDCINALLQVLKIRWELRGQTAPADSQVVLNDIESSLSAADDAFKTMRQLCEAAGVAPDEWDARQLYLEKTLTRPLRTYRSKLLPHHLRTRRMAQTAVEKSD